MTEKIYLEDILSQKAELQKMMAHYRSGQELEKLLRLKELKGRKIIFSGMGSSHFCAYGAAVRLQQHGISSQVISTGELIYYEKECLEKDTVLCLISQSGESAETKHLLELAGDDIFLIAVTNHPESTLGRRGRICFPLYVADEISVTTRTYLSSLIVTQLIAAAVAGEELSPILAEYDKTVSRIGGYLAAWQEETDRLADFCRDMKYICLIGRGDSLSSVRAGALFFREVVKFPALDFDSAEFRHGPMEMVQEDFYGIAFAPSGRTQRLSLQMAADIAAKGGKVILITDGGACGSAVLEQENVLPVMLGEIKEYASPVLQILPVQLLANELAEEKKIPAGVFRWGSKVMEVE